MQGESIVDTDATTVRDEYGRPLPAPVAVSLAAEVQERSRPGGDRPAGAGLHGADVAAHQVRAGVSELIGTFFLVFAGTAVAGSGTLSRPVAGAACDSLAVALASGLVLTALVGALGHVSGAHFNPAVTLALAVTRQFPWRYVPTYVVTQLLGAGLGAAATWATLGGAARSRAKLGATAPAAGVGELRRFDSSTPTPDGWLRRAPSGCPPVPARARESIAHSLASGGSVGRATRS